MLEEEKIITERREGEEIIIPFSEALLQRRVLLLGFPEKLVL